MEEKKRAKWSQALSVTWSASAIAGTFRVSDAELNPPCSRDRTILQGRYLVDFSAVSGSVETSLFLHLTYTRRRLKAPELEMGL